MPLLMVDQAHWAQLEQVQQQIERQVTYEGDMDRFGVPDWWEPATDKGDCEDIVLAKRQRLMELGWPADVLRIAVVLDGQGQLHAVLTVDMVTPRGAPATYVLDSHFTHVQPWSLLSQYGYTWLERSKPGSSQWARLDNGSAVQSVRIAWLASAIMPASPRWVDGKAPAPAKVTVALLRTETPERVLAEEEHVEGVRPAALPLTAQERPLLQLASAETPADADGEKPNGHRHHGHGRHAHAAMRHGHHHGRRSSAV